MLDFGSILLTEAPNLQVRYVLHTAVPGYPGSRDPRPMPADRAADYAVDELQAEALLKRSFQGILQHTAELGATSLCCPAIGCGVRGFPPEVAARVGLTVLADSQDDEVGAGQRSGSKKPPSVQYVEVRFWDHQVLQAWIREAGVNRGLVEVEEFQVRQELWQGDTLAAWTEKRRQAELGICSIA